MKTLYSYLLILSLVALNSCDTLDQEPVSIIAESNFYRNGTDAEAGILGVYDALESYVSNNLIIPTEARADAVDVVRGGNWTRDESFASTQNDGHIENTWRFIYNAIGRANDVLANVPGIVDPNFSEAAKNQILGEAYFIRGFLHLHLVMRWGKVPIVTEAFNGLSQDYQPKRNEIAEVYIQVIEDLQQAKALMPGGVEGKIRASKWAAAGILAKAYLQRNDNGDLALALAELNDIINSQEYSLVPGADYSSLFRPGQQNTSETIFEVSFGPAGLADAAYDQEFVVSQAFRLEPSMKIINAFKADSALVVGNGKEEVRMAAALEYYYPNYFTNRNRYFIDKFTKDDHTLSSGRAQLHPNVIILRLADVLLLKAEILNEQNNTSEAITILNIIRDRVNLPPTTAVSQSDVRLAIENERFLELAFEGHRYWDLIRTNRAVDVINNKGQFKPTQDRLLWPVPQADIDQNANLLPQNPSY